MAKAIVVPDLLNCLPFHDALTWEEFESFCADVLHRKYDSVSTREYLQRGNDQQGIDVYAIVRNQEKITVAQCKLVQNLGPKKIAELIDDFLKGGFADKTNEFILCTNADLTSAEDESKTIESARLKLAAKNIHLKIWDNRGLSLELRTEASHAIINIVYRYFGEPVCIRFYGELWTDYLAGIRPVKKKQYEFTSDYIERAIVSYTNRLKNNDSLFNGDRNNSIKNTLIDLIACKEHPNKKIVLLSTAGFGKSEEIKKIAAFYAGENKYLFPFKYSLLNYRGQSIDALLGTYIEDWKNIPEDQLLLLFDGLDELSEQFFEAFTAALNEFIEQYPKTNCIISSRYNFFDILHPPFFGFDVYLLEPLTDLDIKNYITRKLGSKKEDFAQAIGNAHFEEYLTNPYYLTRLIMFYDQKDAGFPTSKSALFEKILFEGINKDETTYNIGQLKEKLFAVAGQIAFCMTIAGKHAITEEEMAQIIHEEQTRKLLKKCRVVNQHEGGEGAWSFEHKNLQEYMCATVFAAKDFETVQSVVSYKQDRSRLLPAFLNTISFLFELLDAESIFFRKLYAWINNNDPEILVRFEKDKLSVANRQLIFRNIFNYYQARQITVRMSANFNYRELANFTVIDENMLDYLQKHLNPGTSSNILYDVLNIIACCPKPYLYRQIIDDILFSVLSDSFSEPFVKARAITAFVDLGFASKEVFNAVLATGADVNDFEIRKATIYLLNAANCHEDFVDYLLASIPILEKGQRERNQSGSFLILNKLLADVKKAAGIKLILQYCISDKDVIQKYSSFREFNFESKEFAATLEHAVAVYQQDKSIVRFVYRLYLGGEYYMLDEADAKSFISFFERTCGKHIIFMKFYHYGRMDRDLLSFAGKVELDFILEEYKSGKISTNELIAFRNRLSWANQSLFQYFYDKIKTLDESALLVDDEGVDYTAIKNVQLIKNQEMLLDKNLFIEEARTIFSLIPKTTIVASDLWQSGNSTMRTLQYSLAYSAVRSACVHGAGHVTTADNFIGRFSSDNEWNAFAIENAYTIIKEKNKEKQTILPELIHFLENWCISRITALDFRNAIRDDGENFTYNRHIEFVKDIFVLLQPVVADDLLLKMLPADYETFNGWKNEHQTIGAIVVDKVTNKSLLHDTILNNIKNGGLATLVRCGHFKLCADLQYKDAVPALYETISTTGTLSDDYRIKLCEYYIELGGRYDEFTSLLKLPDFKNEQAAYVSFDWFLIEKLLLTAPKVIEPLLFQIIANEPERNNRLKAIEYLLQLSKPEGLAYWEEFVRETKMLPFEHRWPGMQAAVSNIPPERSMPVFFSVLDFAYANNLRDGFAGDHFIHDCIYNSLTTIALKYPGYYDQIQQKFDQLIKDNNGKPFVDTMKFYTERLKQRYFESLQQEITIAEANTLFRKFFVKADRPNGFTTLLLKIRAWVKSFFF